MCHTLLKTPGRKIRRSARYFNAHFRARNVAHTAENSGEKNTTQCKVLQYTFSGQKCVTHCWKLRGEKYDALQGTSIHIFGPEMCHTLLKTPGRKIRRSARHFSSIHIFGPEMCHTLLKTPGGKIRRSAKYFNTHFRARNVSHTAENSGEKNTTQCKALQYTFSGQKCVTHC
jgi:hypothetical protein